VTVPGVAMQNASAKRNVLFVASGREVYGAELSLLPVVRKLGPSWRAHFLVEGAGPLDALLRREGFPVHRLSLDPAARLWRTRRPLLLLRMLHLLRSRRIDLVHVNMHYYAPLVSLACAIAGIPIVVHVRNMIGRPVARDFRNYDGVICISQAVYESLITEGRVLDREISKRLWIIPDGRDLSPFGTADRERVRREWGIGPAVPLVGMAARICPMKGQDTFVRMAALVKQRMPDARFVLVGSSFGKEGEAYLDGLHELVAALGLDNDVIFAGYRQDMPDVLAAMDCFAHPSRRGAFVSVLIEAMASGVPIVATDVDGIPECVGRDGAAVLLPPDNPGAWADAAVDILADPGRATRMAEVGRERASRLFDIAPLARLTVDVLETVYARRTSGG
jgi:glycosyltransferase involved in cell wall biosynthesis